MQRAAAIGLIQSVASCLWHLQRSWLCQTLVLRRSRALSRVRLQPKPWAPIPLAVHFSPNASHGFGVMCALFLAFQCKAASQEITCGLLRLVAWGGIGGGRAAIEPCPAQVWWRPAARFSYSWAMPTRNAVQPNPSLKRSTNGMPPGLVRGCAHIFHGPGLASHRR
jgi:hypothetical protein